jgi:hypoxanthine phosphoribosyltransferase
MGAETVTSPEFVQFDGHLIERLISEKQIGVAVQGLADQIGRDYQDKDPLLVGILKGANVFMVNLMLELGRGNPEIGRPPLPVEIDFLQATSYNGEQSTGQLTRTINQSTPVTGRHVILVEDILDTGHTLTRLRAEMGQDSPASIKICALLDKPDRREVPIEADYCGIRIPNRFVVGYGLDYNQRLRNLPYIGVVVNP